jgi:hypothetical protein
MNVVRQILAAAAVLVALTGAAGQCSADALERAAVAAHLDQLQNIVMECQEVRNYDVDPAVIDTIPFRFRQAQIDLKRTEAYTLSFSFLNGSAYYDRETDPGTLDYWAGKNLPAIARQTTSISTTGRIEELTVQRFANGKRQSYGGLRQLSAFSPIDTMDIAMGLRLLGGRQWLTKNDLADMDEIAQPDSQVVVLHKLDGAGDVHELRFDKSLLFALVYYRCASPNGAYAEIVNSDFHRQGNVFIPGKVVRSSSIVDSTRQVRHPLVFKITVERAAVNDPNNTPSNYAIAWPAHLQLFDSRTNDRIEVGATTRPMTDDDIRQQLDQKRAQDAALDELANQRINQALNQQPATRP